ncbi:MAG: hypothetical protein ABI718_04525 [Acidobacteriota bacterium]
MEDIIAVIRTLNEMEREGVVERYAIGGAVGATFYLEPAATIDVDVFVPLTSTVGSTIVSLDAVIGYLTGRGFEMNREYFMIGGWPVQFLPSSPGLIDEALEQAEEFDLGAEIVARVFKPMHLAAMALQTGRNKDKLRLVQFRDAGLLPVDEFEAILSRYGLVEKWAAFERQFPRNSE